MSIEKKIYHCVWKPIFYGVLQSVRHSVYDFVWNPVSDSARDSIENFMKNYEYKN